MSKRILNFSNEVDEKLKELGNILQKPINKIIAMIVKEKLEDLKKLDKDFLRNNDDDKETEIRFLIKQNERIFLENQIKKTGNTSLSSEIKFRLLNTIYRNKFFLPVELSELGNLNFQIKRIGININQILKKSNYKEVLQNDDYENFINNIDELRNKIDSITKEIKKILIFTKNRF